MNINILSSCNRCSAPVFCTYFCFCCVRKSIYISNCADRSHTGTAYCNIYTLNISFFSGIDIHSTCGIYCNAVFYSRKCFIYNSVYISRTVDCNAAGTAANYHQSSDSFIILCFYVNISGCGFDISTFCNFCFGCAGYHIYKSRAADSRCTRARNTTDNRVYYNIIRCLNIN